MTPPPGSPAPRTGPFAWLGDFVVRRPRAVLGVWLVLAVVGGVIAVLVGGRLENGGNEVPGSQSARVEQVARDHVFDSERSRVSAVVTVPPGASAQLDEIAPRVRRAIAGADHVAEVGEPQVIERAGMAIVPFDVGSGLADAQTQLSPAREAARGASGGAEVTIVGEAASYDRYATVAREDLRKVEVIAFPITSVIILIAFLSIVATAVPTLLAGLVLTVTFGVVFAISQVTELSVFATNTALVLGLALSIDYSLFNVMRYREALRTTGGDIPDAVRETVATTGRAIVFSGLTIATAVASLFILQIGVFSGMAIGVIAAALVAAAGGVTLVPSVLVLGGRHLDRLPIRRFAAAAESARLWKWLAALVLRRRIAVAIGSTAVLAVLALPLLGTQIAFPTVTALPGDDPVRQATEDVQRTVGGAATPVTVVARGDRAELVRVLERQPGIGEPVAVRRGSEGWMLAVAPLLHPTDSEAAQATVRRLRGDLAASPLDAAVGGTTANAIDILDRLNARTPAVVAATLVLSALLLLIAFRSIVVPVKAALTTLLSVGAALGILTFLYEDLGLGQTQELSFFVPLFLFTIIFGLSTDYEVFLLSRIREEFLAGASSDRSIERGLVTSARSITLAGLVMAVVFLAQATSSMEPLQQLGLGMAISVVIDITIVRTFLVPATMALLGRRNWWLPSLRGRRARSALARAE